MSRTTSLEAFLNLLNGQIGSGILSMPKAFGDGGLILSSIFTPIIGFIACYCVHLMINVNDHVCNELDIPIQDYEEVAQLALTIGPKKLRKYANTSKFITCTFIFASQVGACAVYYLFIAENLLAFFEKLKIFEATIELEIYLACLLPVLILLQCVKDIKYLTIPSGLANLLQVASMAIIIYNLVTDVPDINQRGKVGAKFPLFFVTTLFNFEGISIAMPLYKSMKSPKTFGRWFGVVDLVNISIITFNFLLGFLGYVKYGDDVKASVTLSLPEEPLYQSVLIMYAFAVMMTYPLTLYVPIEMTWPSMQEKLMEKKLSLTVIDSINYGYRAILVIITYAMASLIPHLDLILSLVGAITCSCIAIIIPSVLHLIVFWSECKSQKHRVWLFTKNISIVFIGVMSFILGTYYSIVDLIAAISEDSLKI